MLRLFKNFVFLSAVAVAVSGFDSADASISRICATALYPFSHPIKTIRKGVPSFTDFGAPVVERAKKLPKDAVELYSLAPGYSLLLTNDFIRVVGFKRHPVDVRDSVFVYQDFDPKLSVIANIKSLQSNFFDPEDPARLHNFVNRNLDWAKIFQNGARYQLDPGSYREVILREFGSKENKSDQVTFAFGNGVKDFLEETKIEPAKPQYLVQQRNYAPHLLARLSMAAALAVATFTPRVFHFKSTYYQDNASPAGKIAALSGLDKKWDKVAGTPEWWVAVDIQNALNGTQNPNDRVIKSKSKVEFLPSGASYARLEDLPEINGLGLYDEARPGPIDLFSTEGLEAKVEKFLSNPEAVYAWAQSLKKFPLEWHHEIYRRDRSTPFPLFYAPVSSLAAIDPQFASDQRMLIPITLIQRILGGQGYGFSNKSSNLDSPTRQLAESDVKSTDFFVRHGFGDDGSHKFVILAKGWKDSLDSFSRDSTDLDKLESRPKLRELVLNLFHDNFQVDFGDAIVKAEAKEAIPDLIRYSEYPSTDQSKQTYREAEGMLAAFSNNPEAYAALKKNFANILADRVSSFDKYDRETDSLIWRIINYADEPQKSELLDMILDRASGVEPLIAKVGSQAGNLKRKDEFEKIILRVIKFRNPADEKRDMKVQFVIRDELEALIELKSQSAKKLLLERLDHSLKNSDHSLSMVVRLLPKVDKFSRFTLEELDPYTAKILQTSKSQSFAPSHNSSSAFDRARAALSGYRVPSSISIERTAAIDEYSSFISHLIYREKKATKDNSIFK